MNTEEIMGRWEKLLGNPEWYLTIVPEIAKLQEESEKESEIEKDARKAKLYDFFEAHLMNEDIALAKEFPDTDAERKEIDTIVIHHTSNPSGMSKERLSGIELIRLYAPYFYDPRLKEDQFMKRTPIYSGHVRDGRQVFWPYHWFVRNDGSVERLLEDNEIGWQAGSWEVNCRSIAICFDGDYEHVRPSDVELSAAAKIIKEHYPSVRKERILGHREINNKTTCPSELFLSGPEKKGWKEDLLGRIR